jgi:hypothetical protein
MLTTICLGFHWRHHQPEPRIPSSRASERSVNTPRHPWLVQIFHGQNISPQLFTSFRAKRLFKSNLLPWANHFRFFPNWMIYSWTGGFLTCTPSILIDYNDNGQQTPHDCQGLPAGEPKIASQCEHNPSNDWGISSIVEAVLREIDRNQFQDGHIENWNMPISERNLPQLTSLSTCTLNIDLIIQAVLLETSGN